MVQGLYYYVSVIRLEMAVNGVSCRWAQNLDIMVFYFPSGTLKSPCFCLHW